MPEPCEMVRLIRVFVSSPGDVKAERDVLDEVVDRINRSDGDRLKVRLELTKWEKDVAPQIGPGPQPVVDSQMPKNYAIYLGIMKHRFGTPTGEYGSGTEKEFEDALERWGKVGEPWILFYFGKEKVDLDEVDLDQYAKVKAFRKNLEGKGLFSTYEGIRGPDGFSEKVSDHLRKVVWRLHQMESERQQLEQLPNGSATPVCPPVEMAVVPQEYTRWLCDQCGALELMGLQPKEGDRTRLNHIYTPLTTTMGGELQDQHRSDLDSDSPQLLLEFLNRKSLYVSGDPGSGKSVFCRWVAWLVCNGDMPQVDIEAPEKYQEKFPTELYARLPILIPLRDFWKHLQSSDEQSIGIAKFKKAIEKWLLDQEMPALTWSCVAAHLKKGSAFLIFDGVDEVPTIRTSNGHKWYPRTMLLDVLPEAVKRWTRDGNRILVTSRPYGLDQQQQQKLALPQALIQSLDRELQKLLVRRWFVRLSESPDLGEDKAKDMIQHLDRERSLVELAGNPLLLTSMCIIYNEGRRLPEDKHELYDRIVDTVLYKRYPDKTERDEARGTLEAIAFGMHTGEGLKQDRVNPEASTSSREIDLLLADHRKTDDRTAEGRREIARVREGLLSQSGLLTSIDHDQASFFHLSIQEFLAAERLFILLGREKNEFTEQLLRRSESANWRNTLSFVFGGFVKTFKNDQGVTLLREIAGRIELPAVESSQIGKGGAAWNQAVFLGDCLEILVHRKALVPKDLRTAFEQMVTQAIEQEIAVKDRQALAVSLGYLGDAEIVLDLRVQGHPDDHKGYKKIPADQYKNPSLPIKEPFWLSRYPVTNSQFALFIKEGGYQKQELWSQDGWNWLKNEKIDKPRYWRHPIYCAPNQPVVGVSFWEAEAFATWAGGTLPTEQQWEAAARGPDGYEYPCVAVQIKLTLII